MESVELQGDASPQAEPRRDDQLVDHWRSVSAEGNGHDVIANRNTVCRLIRHIDALAAAPQPQGDASPEVPGFVRESLAMIPPDDFKNDDFHLIVCIEALLSLDEAGAIVPHGVGGHARGLLASAAHRLAHPAPAPDVARLWDFVEQAFDHSKTSTCERLLQDLGLPDDSPEMPLSWHINRAQQKGATNGQK